MTILSDEDKKYLEDLFKNFKKDINIVFFSTSDEKQCEQCENIRAIIRELKDISNKIKSQEFSIENDKEEAEKYEVEMAPALVIMGEKYSGVKYYGVPSGYEFSSLIEDISDIGNDDIKIDDNIMEKLKQVDKPVHIKVFITPTCPYCPAAVRTGHKFAMLNENIKADMIESYEFSELSNKYNVQGVPRVIINEDHFFEGALPEENYIDEILKAIK